MITGTLSVNGTRHEVRLEGRESVAHVVREKLGLTGTKVGCEQGVCGSCNVLLDGLLVRSCLLLAAHCLDSRDLVTIEGLDGPVAEAVRAAMRRNHALQCGFCTPGMVMALCDTIARGQAGDEDSVRACLSSNLCRCTGYAGLAAAGVEAARELANVEGGVRHAGEE